jgi:hypothetical protein
MARPQSDSYPEPCPRCGYVKQILGEPDGCLGRLPGVSFACCGHGKRPGYIVFENGIRVRLLGVTKNTFDLKGVDIPKNCLGISAEKQV